MAQSSALIDGKSVPDPNHLHNELSIADFIHNSINTLAHPVALVRRQLGTTLASWVNSKRINFSEDALYVFVGNIS